MVQVKINKNLLPLKAQYFLWNAGTAPVVPFLTVYARQLGLSASVVGIIYGILPVVGMLAKPLFGGVADRYHLQKKLFIFFEVFSALTLFLIHFTPEIPLPREVTFSCGHGETYLMACPKQNGSHSSNSKVIDNLQGEAHCQVNCPTPELWESFCRVYGERAYCESAKHKNPFIFDTDIPLNYTIEIIPCTHFKIKEAYFLDRTRVPYCGNITQLSCHLACESSVMRDLTRESANDSSVTTFYQFWMFIILLILSWIGMAVVVSVGDAICFGMLGDEHLLYGHQRLWGTVGWGIFALFSGWLVDQFSKGDSEKDYTSVFYLALIMLLLDAVVSLRLKYVQTNRAPSIASDVGQLFEKPSIVVFLLWTISVGLCTGLQWQFLFWHLEDIANDKQKERMKTLEGLIMAIQCFGGELPLFFLSGRIIQKIGHINCMSMVLLGFAMRFILYSILSNPWWCLPVELFQGITFGIFYATMASYASKIAPPGTEATVQGIVGALFEGVGVSVGSLMGGYLYDLHKGKITFLSYGIGALVMAVIHVIVQHFLARRNPQSIKLEDPDGSSAHYASPSDAIHILEEHSPRSTS